MMLKNYCCQYSIDNTDAKKLFCGIFNKGKGGKNLQFNFSQGKSQCRFLTFFK